MATVKYFSALAVCQCNSMNVASMHNLFLFGLFSFPFFFSFLQDNDNTIRCMDKMKMKKVEVMYN